MDHIQTTYLGWHTLCWALVQGGARSLLISDVWEELFFKTRGFRLYFFLVFLLAPIIVLFPKVPPRSPILSESQSMVSGDSLPQCCAELSCSSHTSRTFSP